MASSYLRLLLLAVLIAANFASGQFPRRGRFGCQCNGLTVENEGNRVVPYSGQCLS